MKLAQILLTIPIGTIEIPQVQIVLTYPYFDATMFTIALDTDDMARNGITRAEETIVE